MEYTANKYTIYLIKSNIYTTDNDGKYNMSYLLLLLQQRQTAVGLFKCLYW